MRACPSCGSSLRDTGYWCRSCYTKLPPELQNLPPEAAKDRELDKPFPVALPYLRVLGGAGLPLTENETVQLTFTENGMSIARLTAVECFAAAYPDIQIIEISGPGKVEKGGGFMGGGIGVDGALVGIAIAGVLNSLTTSSQTITILQLGGPSWELWTVTSEYDPLTLRILMAPIYVRLSPEARYRPRR